MPRQPQSLHVCTCSACIQSSFIDEHGNELQGALQSGKTIKSHRLADLFRSQNSEHLGAGILLSTLSANSIPPNDTLPERSGEVDSNESREQTRRPGSCQETEDGPEDVEMETASTFESIHSNTHPAPADMNAGSTNQPLRRAFIEISALQSHWAFKSRRLRNTFDLTFAESPRSITEEAAVVTSTNEDSREFISLSHWLHRTIATVRALEDGGDRDLRGRRDALLHDLVVGAQRLDAIKQHCWEMKKVESRLYGEFVADENDGPVFVDTGRWFRDFQLQPILLATLMLASMTHTLSSLSRTEAHVVLTSIRAIIFAAFALSGADLSPVQVALLDGIPLDIRTALRVLDLEPDYKLYACCKSCFALYPPHPRTREGRIHYPPRCTHKPTPSDPECGQVLVRQNADGDDVPIKSFAAQNFNSWIAQLLCRPGVKDLLSKSWEKHDGSLYDDIMQSPAIQQFLGPDNRTPFSVQGPGSYNLVFALFVDWFNPYGNKAAGKAHSVGGMYMTCLNLPSNIRHKPENMFLVGIIPGPREPSLEQINHFLAVLVDPLLTLWHRGIYLSKTATHSSGCLVHAAVIPLICDLPGLRKTAGMMGISADTHFCGYCDLAKRDVNDLSKHFSARRKTLAEHYRHASEWRDARSSKERDALSKKYGVRWCELLRLPYWDITRFSVVDAMHNLYLGELRHHCMVVWGIDVKGKPVDVNIHKPHDMDQQKHWLAHVVASIRKGSVSSMAKARRGYIVAIADMNHVAPSSGTMAKRDYIEALLEWYKQAPGREIRSPTVLNSSDSQTSNPSKLQILDLEVLQALRHDMAKTILPSWISRPPKNFGDKNHGKLKADEWRTVCTVSMVITLVRIWGTTATSQKYRNILRNFLHLVIAVDYGTRRRMSSQRAQFFDDNMRLYLSSLRSNFGHDLRPNHHACLHLKEFMEFFGPVQAWWAFPFERYNGIIAQLKTNKKTNEMPLTFLRYFCMGSTLRWLISSTPWPDNKYFREMQNAQLSAYGDAFRNIPRLRDVTQAFEWSEAKEGSIGHDIYHALLNKINASSQYQFSPLASRGRFISALRTYLPNSVIRPTLPDTVIKVKTVQREGVTFGTSTHSNRNSFVIFKKKEGIIAPNTTDSAGQITDIFYHRRIVNGACVVQPFFVIHAYSCLSEQHYLFDLWRHIPGLDTKLYYGHLEDELHLVGLDEIVSHFAAFPYTPPGTDLQFLLARSLDRVRYTPNDPPSFGSQTASDQTCHRINRYEACARPRRKRRGRKWQSQLKILVERLVL